MADFINSIDTLGDDAVIDGIIDRSITEISDDVITSIGQSAFRGHSALTKVDFPNLKTLGGTVFQNTGLVNAEFPSLTSLGSYPFPGCASLKRAVLPRVTHIPIWGFGQCGALEMVDLCDCTSISGSDTFQACYALKYIILRGSSVCELLGGARLDMTKIASGNGWIFVPEALVESYKAAANWSTYADQIRALEDFTADGTTTGEFGYYTITSSLTNVSISNDATATGPRAYNAALTFDGIYNVNVSVTMGGVDVTGDAYDPQTGQIDIPAVTGDLSIYAACSLSECEDLYIEQGLIGSGSSLGVESDSAKRVRTDPVAFDGSGEVAISSADAEYRITLRGYDTDLVCKAANGIWTTLPGTVSFAYPYIRIVISRTDDGEFDAAVLNDAILMVDGVGYRLKLRET